MEKKQYEETIYCLLALRLRMLLARSGLDIEGLQEIRLRAGRPLLLSYQGQELALNCDGMLSGHVEKDACIVTGEEIAETLEYISGYSLYAFSEELKQGFLTVPGGHRVGLSGRIVMEGDTVSCIRHISFLNIRLAHQLRGCADLVLPYLFSEEGFCNTLIISPPGCGKTTLLRDIIRQLSDGSERQAGMTVGVVDERSEIAGSYLGVPQNDIGIRTDVLDCCPKRQGMMMLLRSMAPQVIAVDEIGGREDREALEYVKNCGCRLLATMHGYSFEDAAGRLTGSEKKAEDRGGLLQVFERFVVLGRNPVGTVRMILDLKGNFLYRASENGL